MKRPWTEGPWHAWDRGIGWEVLCGGTEPPEGERVNQGFRGTFTETDARLIAASPDLYEALQLAVEGCPCSVRERDSGHRIDCYAPSAIEALLKANPTK